MTSRESYPRTLQSHHLCRITTYDDRDFACNSINASTGQYYNCITDALN